MDRDVSSLRLPTAGDPLGLAAAASGAGAAEGLPLSAEPSRPAGLCDRRQVLQVLTAAGIGTGVFRRAVADEVARTTEITAETLARAEWIAGLSLSEAERTATAAAVQGVVRNCAAIRSVPVSYDTLPAVRFDPEISDPEAALRRHEPPVWLSVASAETETAVTRTAPTAEPTPASAAAGTADAPAAGETVAGQPLSFLSIRELGRRLRAGELSSVQLTQYCLQQLREADPLLKCVVTLTEKLALQQAEQADCELQQGFDRGPLHGIPWGAKDLLAVRGYPTTWGAPQFRERQLPDNATVVERLQATGAVLVAKLSLGALAMGDQWFGGMTRNPWNPEQGSSGSSAGSAAAVAAGLVPFAIGSETLGSIVSPSRRCGVTSLRPTFGRVSRAGCMALSWTMDKIGPMAGFVDDLGLVLRAVAGRDAADPTTVDRWYDWPMRADLSQIRVGQVQDRPSTAADEALLECLRGLGAQVVPVSLPQNPASGALTMMLDVEAAAVFHDLLVAGDTDGLNAWPGIFRRSHFVSAVDFLQASRVRYLLMRQMVDVFQQVDMYVGGSDLGLSNLTGHPTLVLPVLMTEVEGRQQPACGTITGRLYDEATLLAVGQLVEQHQQLTGQRPAWQSAG